MAWFDSPAPTPARLHDYTQVCKQPSRDPIRPTAKLPMTWDHTGPDIHSIDQGHGCPFRQAPLVGLFPMCHIISAAAR